MKRNQKRKNNKGFSLVELIIVIAIMAILAGILAPQFIKYINKSKVSADIQNAQQIASALASEYADQKISATTADKAVQIKTGMTDSVKTALGGIAKVKAADNSSFAYAIDSNGQVTIYVVTTDADNAEVSVTSSTPTVYPDKTDTWAEYPDKTDTSAD